MAFQNSILLGCENTINIRFYFYVNLLKKEKIVMKVSKVGTSEQAKADVVSNEELSCKVSDIKHETLTQASNRPLPQGLYKVPVVLAEFAVQIDVESKIKLNCPAYEIKRVEKQVFLTQCRYISGTDKVFIGGYIRKNIEYASKACISKHGMSGMIKDETVQVPFQVATAVRFRRRPRVFPNPRPTEARYYDACRIGKDIREADRASFEIFNEPVYPELLWSRIYDADIDEKGKPIDCLPNEEEFQCFIDKSVVYIGVKLLQKQQIWDPWCKEDGEADKEMDAFYSNPYMDGVIEKNKDEDDE